MNIQTILQKLVALPTITGDHTVNNEALDFIESFVRERGLHVYRTQHDGFGALVATTKQTKKPKVMLVGHVDVVGASADMFELRRDNEKLHGRGVWDMKSGIAGYLLAIEQLRANLENYDFGIMITTDEETRDLGVKKLVGEGYCPTEAAVLLDGAYDWQLQQSAKGAICCTLTIAGESGHGSRPWQVDSASIRLLDLLQEIRELFVGAGPSTNTINVSMLQAGSPGKDINQIPSQATASIDIRAVTNAESDRLQQEIDKLCSKYGAKKQILVKFTALEHDMQNPHMVAFANSIKKQTGITSGGVMSYAASDANIFVELGLACIVTYPVGGGHHGANEWIDVKSLQDIAPVLVDYLQKMAKV